MSSTKEKVMCYLSNMRASVKSSKFDIPYNRQELANYLGVERSALSKELSNLQKQGYITFHKNHFTILKKEG
jgi:CRP-like cAMP-binding protein